MTTPSVMQFRSTSLGPAFLPAPRSVTSFLASLCLHVAGVALLVWLPVVFQAHAAPAVTVADLIHDPNYQVEMLPVLPRLTAPGSLTRTRFHQIRPTHKMTEPRNKVAPLALGRPKPDYVSPQEIVSDLPDATNEVQTIRRPDLLAPPKLKFPIRLPSLVMLPAPPKQTRALPQQAAPQVVQTAPSLPELAMAAKPSVAVPALPISTPNQPSLTVAEQAPPSIAADFSQSAPTFNHSSPVLTADMVADQPKAVVVLNAINVPPAMAPPIPDAELSGHFVVGSSKGLAKEFGTPDAPAAPIAVADSARTSPASNGAALSRITVAGGSGHDSNSPAAASSVASSSGPAAASGPSAAGGAKAAGGGSRNSISFGTGSAGLPGISISGGTPERSGREMARTTPLNPYGLTIVSGGSSGGVTRDLGVFGRNETVYTVYIPMADAGGGQDCPMEYALLNAAPAGNGLLVPPVALKKIQATAPGSSMIANSGLVFIAAVIDETGTLRDLKAILATDARSQSAVRALSQWVFRPAQLDGVPVSSKILIGMTIFPTGAQANQNR